ncbi:MAG: hypothetical protein R3313_00870 [Candidatus Saccharimonadales bacterium]|nr:hypothetical protein [Candidatus Saccharimonadales bacterium]
MQHKDLEVLEFANQAEFIAWLEENYSNAAAYWLKLVKKSSKKKGICYEDAREAALMHGWIDGQANRLDDDFWLVRFTHRRPRSIWSKINRNIINELIAAGRMHPEGLKEVEAAKADGRWDAAY